LFFAIRRIRSTSLRAFSSSALACSSRATAETRAASAAARWAFSRSALPFTSTSPFSTRCPSSKNRSATSHASSAASVLRVTGSTDATSGCVICTRRSSTGATITLAGPIWASATLEASNTDSRAVGMARR
jgi:hypothetical protein